MADPEPNGRIARNALLLTAVAAGCAWLIYSSASNREALFEGARNLGRNLKQRFGDGGNLAKGVIEQAQSLAARQKPPHGGPRKITVDEPMAGYGA